MLRTDEILSTIQMLHAEHLDVRSVTLGLNLDDCSAPSLDHLCRKVRQKIISSASRLVEICDRVGAKYGIPVINKRVAISPADAHANGIENGGRCVLETACGRLNVVATIDAGVPAGVVEISRGPRMADLCGASQRARVVRA